MRQAGRYLPEYQVLRSKYALKDLFFTPELAAIITLMPVKRFDVDAAILFSDITAIAPALGLELSFQEGPVLAKYVTRSNWRALTLRAEALAPVFEAARLVSGESKVPLIGFCGGPFTVATYLVEPEELRGWMRDDPAGFGEFLDLLVEASIVSLRGQIAAGAAAVQVFDSWASQLDDVEFETYCLKPVAKILGGVDVPGIVFCRGSGARAALLAAALPGVALSIDEGCKLSDVRRQVSAPLQGNLHPDVLFEEPAAVRRKVRELLDEMRGDPAFVVNLGHGVRPGTPIASVETMIQEIQSCS